MELVVLVDEQNVVLGTQPKDDVHTKSTPLHRGFSLFLFNSKRQVLLTKRAESKKTFPGVWTNSVCGHPALEETPVDAAKRRLRDELRLKDIKIKEVAPYRYTYADKNGIVENEICPILVAFTDQEPAINLKEVSDWKWVSWETFLEEIKVNPDAYSPWSRDEAIILNSLNLFHR